MRHMFAVFAVLLISAAASFGFAAVTDSKPALAAVSVTGCTGTQVSLTALEKQMLDLHNQERAAQGLPTLCVHPALQQAARAHSKEMIAKDYFSHNSYNGESFSARITRFGYDWTACAENIASGTGSRGEAAPVFRGWMNSSGHRSNILNSRYKEVGIGEAYGSYNSYPNMRMWTVDFGSRAGGASNPGSQPQQPSSQQPSSQETPSQDGDSPDTQSQNPPSQEPSSSPWWLVLWYLLRG